MRTLKSLVFGLGTALAVVAVATAAEQGCGEVDLARLARHVEDVTGQPQRTLFVTERADLAAKLVELQFLAKTDTMGRGEPSLPLAVTQIRVFELSREGHRIYNGNLVEVAVDLDDAPRWRLGYACVDKSVYHLLGFTDTTQGFNALVKSLKLKLSESERALEVQSLFEALTYRDGAQRIIGNKLGLMRVALTHYSGPDSLDDFMAYWSKCPKAIRRKVGSPYAVVSGDGFAVSYFVGAEDGVHEVLLHLDRAGQVQAQDRKLIYPWPTLKVKYVN